MGLRTRSIATGDSMIYFFIILWEIAKILYLKNCSFLSYNLCRFQKRPKFSGILISLYTFPLIKCNLFGNISLPCTPKRSLILWLTCCTKKERKCQLLRGNKWLWPLQSYYVTLDDWLKKSKVQS